MTQQDERLRAVKMTVPVMCGYIFLGIAFGATLSQAGFGPAWALAISIFVYAGSLQFVMVPMLVGTSFLAVAITAIMVNARHLFYGISYIDRFKRMGVRYPYMVFSLTDETYSLFCSLDTEKESDSFLMRVSLYDQFYWVFGSIIGSILAGALPFDLTGIDFSMTALFVVICVERMMVKENRVPLAIGAVCSLLSLFVLGADRFLVPALAATACILVLMDIRTGKEVRA